MLVALAGDTLVVVLVALMLAMLLLPMLLMVKNFKRCPPNRMLVVFGQGVPGGMKIVRGGGVLVWPLIQSSKELSLEPLRTSVVLEHGLTRDNERFEVCAVVTTAIGGTEQMARRAAECLIGSDEDKISGMVRDIAVGSMRLVVAELGAEELNEAKLRPDKLAELCQRVVGEELEKLGLEVLNFKIDRVAAKA
jgi:flotillin